MDGSLRHFIDQLDDPVFITDTAGRIEHLNPAFARAWGNAAMALIGREVDSLADHPADEKLLRSVWETARGGRTWKGRLDAGWSIESAPARELLVVPIQGAGDMPDAIAAILRDRTELRELEDRLSCTQRLETVGIVAGNIAHDFNNLLTIIGCNASSAQELLPPGDPVRRLLGAVQDASDQAAELVRDLLTFKDQAPPRSIPCELNAVVTEAARLMRKTMPSSVELRTACTDDELCIQGDPSRLHQLIAILSLCARDGMPGGGVLTLSTSVRFVEQSDVTQPLVRVGRFAVLSVTDDAVDEGPRSIAELFETSAAGEAEGGLRSERVVVRSTIESHRGWAEQVATPDGGRGVAMYFPITESHPEESPAAVAPERMCGSGVVVVVDDEPMIVALVRTVLESRGYRAVSADRVSDAVSLLGQHAADLAGVVLDWTLSTSSGVTAYEELRRASTDVPIVVTCGNLPAADRQNLAGDAWARFVPKPFSPTQVLEALHDLRSDVG